MAILFVFLDGVGLAPAGPDNPLSDTPMPSLHELLGGPLVLETAQSFPHWQRERRAAARAEGLASFAFFAARNTTRFTAIDATLGVDGLPQSGTGQTALLAGVNAAALHGRHQPHTPPIALRPLLAEQNILRRVVERGGRATFANAFTDGYWQALATRRTRKSASVIAAEGAGIRLRDLDDLRRGAAVAWDITGAAMRERGAAIELASPEQAGRAFASLGEFHDLVFYENFLPDLAGHARTQMSIHEVFTLIDSFLGAAIAAMRPQDTLILTSDHGNVESISAPTHTRNPVPLLAIGAQATAFASVTDISQIAAAIMSVV